jgi:hypothetical protein
MTWRTLGIVALGVGIAAALSLRSCAERDVRVLETEQEPKPDRAAETITTEAVAREALDPTIVRPAEATSPVPVAAPASDLERFLEIRGVPSVAWMETELTQFAAQPRDPAWATGMEARFQSELAESSATVAERYVECRRSLCIALLVHPRGGREPVQRGPLLQPEVSEALATAQALDVIMGPASAVMTRDGAFVQWYRYHRKCGADWKCLE